MNVIDVSKILRRRTLRSARNGQAYVSFYDKKEAAELLLEYSEKYSGTKRREVVAEARKQFVISLVTAFEVYLADLVTQEIESGRVASTEKIFEVIGRKGNYSIKEVAEIIKNEISLAEIIRNDVNFQNADAAFSILSALFGENFQECVKSNRFSFTGSTLGRVYVSLRRDFRKGLDQLLESRHEYIHDLSFSSTPSGPNLERFNRIVTYLCMCIDMMSSAKAGDRDIRIIRK